MKSNNHLKKYKKVWDIEFLVWDQKIQNFTVKISKFDSKKLIKSKQKIRADFKQKKRMACKKFEAKNE